MRHVSHRSSATCSESRSRVIVVKSLRGSLFMSPLSGHLRMVFMTRGEVVVFTGVAKLLLSWFTTPRARLEFVHDLPPVAVSVPLIIP